MKKDDFLKIIRSSAKQALTEQDESFFGSIGQAVEEAFTADSVNRKKEIEGLTNLLGGFDAGETAAGVIRSLAAKVDALEAQTKRQMGSIDQYKLKSLLEAKKDEIKAARKGGAPWEIEFKAKRAASAMMQTTTVVTGATAFNNPNLLDDMEVVVIQYPKNFILDAIDSRQVSVVPANWKWKEQKAVSDGVPTVVTEGSTKPLTDKSFEWKYATRVKYAGRIEMTEEVEIDFEQLVLDIVSMFQDDVIRVWQDAVIAAIIAWASTYTSTTLDGTLFAPSVYSVIGAGKLWIQDQNHQPDVVIMNPGDAAEAIYLQTSTGEQQFIPEALQFGGLTPFLSNKITAGKILIGTKSLVKEQHGNFIIRKGTYGTQFIENESTIVGEIFSILKLPTLSKLGWVYLDIATVKAALKKAGA